MDYEKLWNSLGVYLDELIDCYNNSLKYCGDAGRVCRHVVWKMDELEKDEDGREKHGEL